LVGNSTTIALALLICRRVGVVGAGERHQSIDVAASLKAGQDRA
jgi:hypothetical protein